MRAAGTSYAGDPLLEDTDAVVWKMGNSTPYGAFIFPTGDPDGDGELTRIDLRFPGQMYYGVG